MQRKIIAFSIVAAVSVFLALQSVSAKPYGMAGCGLGSEIIKRDGFAQVFAATTNATGTQTFGITSGTSNCVEDTGLFAYQNKRVEGFVTVNYFALEQEMAAGRGEKLEALSEMMGCNSSTAFGEMARARYSELFSREGTPVELLQNMKDEIAKNPALSCTI